MFIKLACLLATRKARENKYGNIRGTCPSAS